MTMNETPLRKSRTRYGVPNGMTTILSMVGWQYVTNDIFALKNIIRILFSRENVMIIHMTSALFTSGDDGAMFIPTLRACRSFLFGWDPVWVAEWT